MHQNSVYLFVKWQVKQGHLDTILSLLPELVNKSTGEEGNLFYQVHQSNSEASTLVLFEGYHDEAALAAHRNSEHFQVLVLGKIIPLLENREVVLTTQLF